MSAVLLLLFSLSLACDIGGQLCFKLSADHKTPDSAPTESAGWRKYWIQLTRSPWLWGGVAIFVLEFIIWLQVLARAPLSLALPVASLNYCGVALASRLFLGEKVNLRRWLGIACITFGVAVAAAN